MGIIPKASPGTTPIMFFMVRQRQIAKGRYRDND